MLWCLSRQTKTSTKEQKKSRKTALISLGNASFRLFYTAQPVIYLAECCFQIGLSIVLLTKCCNMSIWRYESLQSIPSLFVFRIKHRDVTRSISVVLNEL